MKKANASLSVIFTFVLVQLLLSNQIIAMSFTFPGEKTQQATFSVQNVPALKQVNEWECGYYALYHVWYYGFEQMKNPGLKRESYKKFLQEVLFHPVNSKKIDDKRRLLDPKAQPIQYKYLISEWLSTDDIVTILGVLFPKRDENANNNFAVISKTDLETMPLEHSIIESIRSYQTSYNYVTCSKKSQYVILNPSNNHWFVAIVLNDNRLLTVDSLSEHNKNELHLQKLMNLYTNPFPIGLKPLYHFDKEKKRVIQSANKQEQIEEIKNFIKVWIYGQREFATYDMMLGWLRDFVDRENISITQAHLKYLFDRQMDDSESEDIDGTWTEPQDQSVPVIKQIDFHKSLGHTKNFFAEIFTLGRLQMSVVKDFLSTINKEFSLKLSNKSIDKVRRKKDLIGIFDKLCKKYCKKTDASSDFLFKINDYLISKILSEGSLGVADKISCLEHLERCFIDWGIEGTEEFKKFKRVLVSANKASSYYKKHLKKIKKVFNVLYHRNNS